MFIPTVGINAVQFQEKETLQAVAKAGNELLIWLTQVMSNVREVEVSMQCSCFE